MRDVLDEANEENLTSLEEQTRLVNERSEEIAEVDKWLLKSDMTRSKVMTTEPNEPAFSSPETENAYYCPGLTKLEWFTGMALASGSILYGYDREGDGPDDQLNEITTRNAVKRAKLVIEYLNREAEE